ncbi:MAG: sigma-70 family RNA polymerase sigma factor [Chitinophagaceae bacterium]|nr:sigma-70 family RNA polymerase sigma factor [Chitinophagaceae bacterium]
MDSLHTILKSCLKEDRKSQQCLYEKYYRYALKIAFRYISDYNDALTITNDAFIKVFKNLKQFDLKDGEGFLEPRFFGWLKRIVVNTALDSLKKNDRQTPIETLDDTACWDIPESSDMADSKILYKELIGYLKDLPPSYNKVFNLFVIDGYSHAEIAEMLNISIGASKSNLFKAKEILQKNIADFFETKKV